MEPITAERIDELLETAISYWPFRVEVYLGGERVEGVLKVNTREGWIEAINLDECGENATNIEDGVTQRRFGKVDVIILPKDEGQ